jgi:hypothetical protein
MCFVLHRRTSAISASSLFYSEPPPVPPLRISLNSSCDFVVSFCFEVPLEHYSFPFHKERSSVGLLLEDGELGGLLPVGSLVGDGLTPVEFVGDLVGGDHPACGGAPPGGNGGPSEEQSPEPAEGGRVLLADFGLEGGKLWGGIIVSIQTSSRFCISMFAPNSLQILTSFFIQFLYHSWRVRE